MSHLLSPLELERLTPPTGRTDLQCIEAIASRYIAELGISGPPVDLGMVASFVDIASVKAVRGLDAAGCLITSPEGRSEIQVRAEDTVTRQRFSTGHEIGHTFFPGYSLQPQFRCAPSITLRPLLDTEALCDAASSELLLPRQLLLKRLRGMRLDLDLVENVSEAFEASLVATASKIVRQSDRPAAVLTLEVRNKPAERGTNAPPVLRLRSAITSDHAWPYFPPHKSAAPGDVFSRALEGEVVYEPNTTVKGLTKMPITCEVHAKLYPYTTPHGRQLRVIALLHRA